MIMTCLLLGIPAPAGISVLHAVVPPQPGPLPPASGS
jgi:H+/gluconate symporter-like permease